MVGENNRKATASRYCVCVFCPGVGATRPCSKASSARVWFLALLGGVALIVAAVLVYRSYWHSRGHSVSERASVSCLKVTS